MANALELLAKEYEAEESQTVTTALEASEFSRFKAVDNNSDDSDENTVIEEYEETIIQNNDTYIDKLINDKQNSGQRYSESNTTMSPNFAMSPSTNYVHQQSSMDRFNRQMTTGGKSVPALQPQMSQDFLLIVENLQKELGQKDKALEIIAKQLKQKQSDYDKMITKNEALNKQIKQLRKLQKDNDNKTSSSKTEIESIQAQLIEKQQIIIEKNDNIDKLNDKIIRQNTSIQSLTKEIDAYQNIAEWLEMQMKWESNGSVTSRQNSQTTGDQINDKQTINKPKLTVKALEEWKFSIISNQQNGFNAEIDDIKNETSYINEDEEKQIEQQPTPKNGYQTINDNDDNNDDNDNNYDDDEDEEAALLSNNEDDGDGKSKTKKKKKKKKKDKKKRDTLRTQIDGETENALNADNSGCCIPWFSQGP